MNYNEHQVDVDGRNNVPDLYGPMWLTATYMIMLMICANLGDYFISANDQYIFNVDYCWIIVGIVLIYTLSEGLVYRAVIGCLKGNMKTSQVINCYILRVFVWQAMLMSFTIFQLFFVLFLPFTFTSQLWLWAACSKLSFCTGISESLSSQSAKHCWDCSSSLN